MIRLKYTIIYFVIHIISDEAFGIFAIKLCWDSWLDEWQNINNINDNNDNDNDNNSNSLNIQKKAQVKSI